MNRKGFAWVVVMVVIALLVVVTVAWYLMQNQNGPVGSYDKILPAYPTSSTSNASQTISTFAGGSNTTVIQTEGCTLLPYAGNVPLSHVPYYTSGDPDFRGGMICKFVINLNLPIFTFHFIGNSDNTLGNIQITEGTSTQIVQTIKEGDPGEYGISYDTIAPDNYQDILVPVDANFDGYKDLPILTNCGATGNCSYDFLSLQFLDQSICTKCIFEQSWDTHIRRCQKTSQNELE